MSRLKRLRDDDAAYGRAIEAAESAEGNARKRRRGEAAYERFDINVRTLWEALDELVLAHVIFGLDGVIDVIVMYARPRLPAYAKLPERIAGQQNIGVHEMGSCHLFNIPRGATISCWNELHPSARADAIVVVAPSELRRSDDHSRWRPRYVRERYPPEAIYVGLIVPVVRLTYDDDDNDPEDRRPQFGADRSLFLEHIPLDDSEAADPKRNPNSAAPHHASSASSDAKAPAKNVAQRVEESDERDWKMVASAAAMVPPREGYYAVHYVNLSTPVGPRAASRGVAQLDRATGRFIMRGPTFSPNSHTRPFPSAHNSHQRVHLLPTELDHIELENRLFP